MLVAHHFSRRSVMFTNTIAARSRRFTITVTATLAVTLTAMLGFAMSAAPVYAGAWDYLLPAPGACGPAESNANAAKMDQVRAGVCLANAVRQNYGRTRLGPEHSGGYGNARLYTAAYFKARDVMTCQTGNPHYACGRAMGYRLTQFSYSNGSGSCPHGRWSESIYTGWGHPSNTVRAAVRWWVNSNYGHRDALLNPSFTQHGMNFYGPGTYRGNANTIAWVHYLCN
jgi:hypothetical protein